MKIDIYNNKERYIAWRNKVKEGIPEISPENYRVMMQYLDDMERGLNVSSKNAKGSRSYLRLASLKERMIFYAKKFKEIYGLNSITDISEEQIISFYADMRNGKIPRKDGKTYKSIETKASNSS